jgi:hypothetical protein
MSADQPVRKLVNKKQFLALYKHADQKKTRVASISGEIGERIKEASENGHLHRQLFGLMLKLGRMDELKREDFIAQFPEYCRMCREGGIFGQEHVGNLFDRQEEGEDGEDAGPTEDEVVAENVHRLKTGISKIPDEEFDDATATKPSRRRQKKATEESPADEKPASYTFQ